MKRFIMNNFFMEKNSTIVSFPVDNLDFETGILTKANKIFIYIYIYIYINKIYNTPGIFF